jgi:diguanylate cyclase (GGDEF)-like protein
MTMENLDKTLAEQLQITKWEIDKRKELLNITPSDEELLKSYKPLFSKYIDGIVKNFYERQTNIAEISLLIGDAETLRRLKKAMRRYILELFDGHYDEHYVNQRLRIGKVHQRIGVSSKLYIAAIDMLRTVLFATVDMKYFEQAEYMKAAKLKTAINKLLMFDIQLVFDTYISSLVDEVTAAKDEVANYASNLENEVADRTRQLEELSLKDGLTGLYNQRAFYEHLRREMSSGERHEYEMSLCYFDLNGFKVLNDEHGHLEGDTMLQLVGQSMLEGIRDSDIACRYGGDEFAVILPKSGLADAEMVVGRIINNFKAKDTRGISFSVGVATVGPDDYPDVDSFVKLVDTLMYKSKAKSKKKPGFYIATTNSDATAA